MWNHNDALCWFTTFIRPHAVIWETYTLYHLVRLIANSSTNTLTNIEIINQAYYSYTSISKTINCIDVLSNTFTSWISLLRCIDLLSSKIDIPLKTCCQSQNSCRSSCLLLYFKINIYMIFFQVLAPIRTWLSFKFWWIIGR